MENAVLDNLSALLKKMDAKREAIWNELGIPLKDRTKDGYEVFDGRQLIVSYHATIRIDDGNHMYDLSLEEAKKIIDKDRKFRNLK